MAKLYATLETSKGKTVSISDNEQITATVYDGNMKAYSVIIEWCDVGDIMDNDGNELPESLKTKGAIITSREWRNEPDKKKERKETCSHEYTAEQTLIGQVYEQCMRCGHIMGL